MKIYNKFKWVSAFYLLSLFSTLSIAQVREGGWLSEGGNFLKNATNPWFISNIPPAFLDENVAVKYCIKHDSNQISLTLEQVRSSINEAISFWYKDVVCARQKVEKAQYFLNLKFVEAACDKNIDLVFNIGTLSEVEKKYIPELKSIVALTVRTQYDEEKLRGRGFIYISPDVISSANRAIDLPANIWSAKESGLLLTLVLQHELGHVLGIQHGHVQGDVMQLMSADFVENLLLRSGINEITSNNIGFFYTPYNLEDGSFATFNHRVIKKESCDSEAWDARLTQYLKLPESWNGCIKIVFFKGSFTVYVKEIDKDWQSVGRYVNSRPKILSYENVITLYVNWDKQKYFPQHLKNVGNYLPLQHKRVYMTSDGKFLFNNTTQSNPATVSNAGGLLTFGGSFEDQHKQLHHISNFEKR